MDAHALLTAQGWRGTGHSLHPTSDGNGLAHHILIRRNADGAGLGSRKDHKAEAWWMSAFDQALKGIDVGGGAGVRQTLRGGGALGKITSKGAAKYTGSRGLYQSFVPGGVLEGTVETTTTGGMLPTPPDSDVADKEDQERPRRPRKEESKEERRARREAKRLRKERRRAEKEDKERKKKNKECEREERRWAAEKVQKKKAKKAERQEKEKEKEARRAAETKEERRARRDARRKRKEERRRLRAQGG